MLMILREEVNKRGGFAIRQNAMPDHIHLLLHLPPTVVIADFIGTVKGATAFRVNRQLRPKFKLRWQDGYGVLSLRKDELKKVSQYIDDQEEHHRKMRVSKLLEISEILQPDWPIREEAP